ncbi:Hypothetical predicted protein [Mytilus galloprovincialis]|uniref:B box-type domain-containing protein n=1 Tax=Mytilus galloprovincialis TaxID=29158 RepID=A0A8B6CRS6_MYTGA|nr:Hypothetical predicted protein [Mytilus galloprovincialis]
MALSKPQLGIQSPIQCQLCERDPKISWKCLECDLLMCSACKNNVHPTIKTAGKHRIIHINDIGKISTPSKNTGCISSSSNDLGRTLGSTEDCSSVDMTVVEEHQTKIKEVSQLAIALDDSLWIGDEKNQSIIRLFTSHTGLQKVKCEGNMLKVISSFNIDIFGLAIYYSW